MVTGQGRTAAGRQGRAERAGQGRAGQGRAEQGRAGQGRAEQGRAEQRRAGRAGNLDHMASSPGAGPCRTLIWSFIQPLRFMHNKCLSTNLHI